MSTMPGPYEAETTERKEAKRNQHEQTNKLGRAATSKRIKRSTTTRLRSRQESRTTQQGERRRITNKRSTDKEPEDYLSRQIDRGQLANGRSADEVPGKRKLIKRETADQTMLERMAEIRDFKVNAARIQCTGSYDG